MDSVTVKVSDELKEQMNRYSDVNWSEVARTAFEKAIVREERKKAIEKVRAIVERDDGHWDGVEEIRKWRSHKP